MPRAILFASATATTGTGLRSSIRASHDPLGAPWREAQRITAVARFTGPHTLALDTGETIEAERIVVATGSVPVKPALFDVVGDRLIVNDDVFYWADLPGSVAVFGAGAIGLELAQALARLGVRVRLFGKGGGVGGISDPDVRARAAEVLAAGLPFLPDADVQDISRDGDAVVVRFAEDGALREERFDWLLAATGRKPALDGLDLAASGLALDARGTARSTARSSRSSVRRERWFAFRWEFQRDGAEWSPTVEFSATPIIETGNWHLSVRPSLPSR